MPVHPPLPLCTRQSEGRGEQGPNEKEPSKDEVGKDKNDIINGNEMRSTGGEEKNIYVEVMLTGLSRFHLPSLFPKPDRSRAK